jgi:hypothetical protein
MNVLALPVLALCFGEFGDRENKPFAIKLRHPSNEVTPIALHRQESCPKDFDYSKLNPFVIYLTGHMRTFRNYTAPHLQNHFCSNGRRRNDVFLSVMATRSMDSLAHDSTRRDPRSSKLELDDLGSKTPFCDPFFAIILEDAVIAQAMPPPLVSFFGKTGKDMHGTSTAGQTENPKQGPMEMLGRLNLLYLKRAHQQGLIEYERMMGHPMPPEQLIIKMRPDAEPAQDLLSNLHGLAAVFKENPNAFFTTYHPVWGLQDIVFITTRQVMDKIVRIDMNCITDGGIHQQSQDNYRTPEIFLVCTLKAVGAKVFYYGGGAAMFRMDEIQHVQYPGKCSDRKTPSSSDNGQFSYGGDIAQYMTKPTAMKHDTAEDGVSYAENTFDHGYLTCNASCLRPAGDLT